MTLLLFLFNPHKHKMGSRRPKHIFGNYFYWKSQKAQEVYDIIILPDSGPRGPTIRTKFIISCKFDPLQVKRWYHMFSNMKLKECMESEFLGVFRVKVVTKNILLGSLGTQLQAVFAMWCLFLKKQRKFLNQTFVFLAKQYTSLIYVKEK